MAEAYVVVADHGAATVEVSSPMLTQQRDMTLVPVEPVDRRIARKALLANMLSNKQLRSRRGGKFRIP